MSEVPEGFSQSLPAQLLVWDASRALIAQRCWREHWYATVRGLRHNPQEGSAPASVHTEFGTFLHGACEAFDSALCNGYSIEIATLNALNGLLKATWIDGRPWGGEVVECWQCTDPEYREHKRQPGKLVLNRERCQWAKEPSMFMPLTHSGFCGACGHAAERVETYLPYHAKKNRLNLVRAFLLYADTPNPIEPIMLDGKPAVEKIVSLILPFKTPAGEEYRVVGKIDALGNWEEEHVVRERKTTSLYLGPKYWASYEPNIQVSNYSLLAGFRYGVDGDIWVVIEAFQIGTDWVRLQRYPIKLGKEQRSEWLEELHTLIHQAEERATAYKAGLSPEAAWPRRLASCSRSYGFCQFRDVCRLPGAQREEVLRQNYHEERWNPLSEEEEE